MKNNVKEMNEGMNKQMFDEMMTFSKGLVGNSEDVEESVDNLIEVLIDIDDAIKQKKENNSIDIMEQYVKNRKNHEDERAIAKAERKELKKKINEIQDIFKTINEIYDEKEDCNCSEINDYSEIDSIESYARRMKSYADEEYQEHLDNIIAITNTLREIYDDKNSVADICYQERIPTLHQYLDRELDRKLDKAFKLYKEINNISIVYGISLLNDVLNKEIELKRMKETDKNLQLDRAMIFLNRCKKYKYIKGLK